MPGVRKVSGRSTPPTFSLSCRVAHPAPANLVFERDFGTYRAYRAFYAKEREEDAMDHYRQETRIVRGSDVDTLKPYPDRPEALEEMCIGPQGAANDDHPEPRLLAW